MQQIIEMAKGFDWSPFWISLKTGIVATVICFFLGLFAARKVLKMGPKARAVVDGILTLPMVMAPTVAGFFLLLLFSLRRPIGAFLYEQMGIKVVQTWLGCIIAASVIAFPLMYRNARAAFEQVDPDLIYAARTLGMKERTIFWRVVIHAAAITRPFSTATSRRPVTANSRASTIMTAHAGILPHWIKITMQEITSSLSAKGSRNFPKLLT